MANHAEIKKSDIVLDIKGLTVCLPKGADRKNAVEEVSITIGKGEIVCIVGESGSGKSVTAHTVMGLAPKDILTPMAGTVQLNGEELLEVSEARLRKLRGERMAMIFQEPMTALNPVMRVGDQISEILEVHTNLSRKQRQTRIIEIMSDVHLPDPKKLVRSYPHQLSGGQRQRIMIAIALVLEPGLLIADEPTTALDVTTEAQILKLIKDIQVTRGTAVMFITHDFGVVAEIADKVVVMRDGRVVEAGPVEQILTKAKDPYTKMLIDAVPSMVPPERKSITAGEPILTTSKLNKIYGTVGGWLGKGRVVHAAKDVELEVRRGETLGVVGESGSGKSTVARCIVRLVEPSSGKVLIDGQSVRDLIRKSGRAFRSDIQIVFQDPYRSLNPRRTAGQSIVEGPMNFGISHDEAIGRARNLMKIVGLRADALDRFPHQFSGGQRQRICIARALAMEPKILIADEAVSALDVSVQAQVLDLLDEVRDRFELAMLFITHDLRVAAQICDRIMVMKLGEVVEQGPTASVYANPQHEYTRLLLDAAPGTHMNFGQGKTEKWANE